MNNPLLKNTALPAFNSIKPEQVIPALEQILHENKAKIATLLNDVSQYTWDNLMVPLQLLDNRLSNMWSPISHLNAVMNSQALREVYSKALPKLAEYTTELLQNEQLYLAVKSIAESKEFTLLNAAQQKVIQNDLRDFELAGVGLAPAKKQQFAMIQQKLAELDNQYEQNLLDATNAWQKHITDEKQLAGLPQHALLAAKEAAKNANLPGWLLNLEIPCYTAVITHADNRALREEMYTAYSTRASDQGPNAGKWDNSQVMQQILSLKKQAAALLGYENYADVSLVRKMAESTAVVFTFLTDLAGRVRPQALNELAELQTYAQQEYAVDELHSWDIAYYAEKLRLKRYAVSQETLRPYFPEPTVLHGMFNIIKTLFGMRVEQKHDVATWHPDVRFYEVYDEKNHLRGQFYLDLYARAHKRGGAWMDDCRVRLNDHDKIQTPVAYLTCNFSKPLGDQPALLTHSEVITLFHEFGHTLHHILTKVDYAPVAGINGVPWDAVEFPSQFMENFCWQRQALDLISAHVESGEKIPNELYQKMLAAKNFQAGMKLVRQLELALFDMRLHCEFDEKTQQQIQTILNEVRSQVAVMIPPNFNRFQHGFSHIFAGGYAAGYYSYLWAEVMAQDAFALFEEKGVFDQTTGKAYLNNILEQGGTQDPQQLFIALRGRPAKTDALLKSYGLTESRL